MRYQLSTLLLTLSALVVGQFACLNRASAQSACSVEEPRICATLQNVPPMIAGKALTFDVVFSAPTQALKAELVWDSEEDSLRIVSVPEKIIALDSLSYTLKRVITVFDGTWSLDLLIQAQGKKSFIQIPVEILPAPAP